MHELCRFAFSKPAKFQGGFSKPEKAIDGKSIHELCRFAGLFSIVPTKNTRFFHWAEQCRQEVIYEETDAGCS
jgi:hypothetical protein